MNLLDQHSPYKLQLEARNEGKIKFHDSCNDIRAWSHDIRQRDRYLKEWIKRDMPLCVIPVSTLVGFFRAMTCKSKGRVTPRCHPDCKSKVLLDSITTVSEAIRICLKDGTNMEKLICEEEFETSHWPCEKCLDALKNIKLFWKLILDKLFFVSIKEDERLEQESCHECGAVRDIARCWEQEMLSQVNFIKNMIPKILKANERHGRKTCLKKISSFNIKCPNGEGKYKLCRKPNKVTICETKRSHSKRDAQNYSKSSLDSSDSKEVMKSSKCVTANVDTAEAICNTTDMTFFSEYCDLEEVKAKYNCLKKDYECQKYEIEKLKQQNKKLKSELENAFTECPPSWKSQLICGAALLPTQDAHVLYPEPFEASIDDALGKKCPLKDAESELLITMKNCRHERFRHVSLLQVLHKTNDPIITEGYEGPSNDNGEDPITLLTKVQKTLGAMVDREMVIAKSKTECDSSEIKASFERTNLPKAF